MANAKPLVMGSNGRPRLIPTGDTVPVANGGTGATTASAARTALGLAAIAASGSASDLSAGTVPSARLSIATQANQETATSTTTLVTPGRQQYHPGSAKGWVTFSVSGGTVTVRSSYNVASVSRSSAGVFLITFSTAMSAQANLCVVASAGLSGSRLHADLGSYTSYAAGQCAIVTSTLAGTLTDPDVCSAVFFGDQ